MIIPGKHASQPLHLESSLTFLPPNHNLSPHMSFGPEGIQISEMTLAICFRLAHVWPARNVRAMLLQIRDSSIFHSCEIGRTIRVLITHQADVMDCSDGRWKLLLMMGVMRIIKKSIS
jgi:hypothetical protein